jgi:hypothetical protein
MILSYYYACSFEKVIKIDPLNNRAVEGLQNIPD